MTAIIRTPNGTITSLRVAWRAGERDVYTWRCDAGEPPHRFESEMAAVQWMEHVWASASAKEIRERQWSVVS